MKSTRPRSTRTISLAITLIILAGVFVEKAKAFDDFCFRKYTSPCHEHNDGRNDDDEGKYDDPIHCIANPDTFEPNGLELYGTCLDFTTTVDAMPTGFSDEDAGPCFVDSEDADTFTITCYYNLLTNEFCSSFNGSGRDFFDCYPIDEGAQVYWYNDCCYSCPFRNRHSILMKRGKCDAPVQTPQLPDVPVTDEFINAQNERINGDGCSLEDLQTASVSDQRKTLIQYQQCYKHVSTTCYDQEPIVLEGRRLQYVHPRDVHDEYLKAQRYDDNTVCFAWLAEVVGDSAEKSYECRTTCAGLGEQVTLVYQETNKYSAGYFTTREFHVTATDENSTPDTKQETSDPKSSDGTSPSLDSSSPAPFSWMDFITLCIFWCVGKNAFATAFYS